MVSGAFEFAQNPYGEPPLRAAWKSTVVNYSGLKNPGFHVGMFFSYFKIFFGETPVDLQEAQLESPGAERPGWLPISVHIDNAMTAARVADYGKTKAYLVQRSRLPIT